MLLVQRKQSKTSRNHLLRGLTLIVMMVFFFHFLPVAADSTMPQHILRYLKITIHANVFFYPSMHHKISEHCLESLPETPKSFQDLQKRFPEEKEAIERYVDMVVKCNKSAAC